VLVAAGRLAQHPLAEQQQHEQSDRERGLDDDEWSEPQRDDLERPADDRDPGPEHPA